MFRKESKEDNKVDETQTRRVQRNKSDKELQKIVTAEEALGLGGGKLQREKFGTAEEFISAKASKAKASTGEAGASASSSAEQAPSMQRFVTANELISQGKEQKMMSQKRQ